MFRFEVQACLSLPTQTNKTAIARKGRSFVNRRRESNALIGDIKHGVVSTQEHVSQYRQRRDGQRRLDAQFALEHARRCFFFDHVVCAKKTSILSCNAQDRRDARSQSGVRGSTAPPVMPPMLNAIVGNELMFEQSLFTVPIAE
jgi:hypothetical protein